MGAPPAGGVATANVDAAFARKLGIKPGHRVCLVTAPAGFDAALRGALPEGARLLPWPAPEADVIVAWATAADGLREAMAELRRHLEERGSLWVVVPKRSSGLPGPTFAQVQEAAFPHGLVDTKDLTFSPTHYGVRLVVRREHRTGVRRP